MRYFFLSFSLVLMLLGSCTEKTKSIEGPLSSVIKLFSAEEDKDFEEAIKYIDVDRVYADCKQENKTPMECWKERVNFSYSLGQTNKFTNRFKYHNYKIMESVQGGNAKVEFTPLKAEVGRKGMILELEFRNSNWVVVRVSHF